MIVKMMTYGAKLTPADQQKLIAYLNGLGITSKSRTA